MSTPCRESGEVGKHDGDELAFAWQIESRCPLRRFQFNQLPAQWFQSGIDDIVAQDTPLRFQVSHGGHQLIDGFEAVPFAHGPFILMPTGGGLHVGHGL
jgi:hypothetical protein